MGCKIINVPCFFLFFFFSNLKGKAIYIFNSFFFQRLKRFESSAPENILDSVCQVINYIVNYAFVSQLRLLLFVKVART